MEQPTLRQASAVAAAQADAAQAEDRRAQLAAEVAALNRQAAACAGSDPRRAGTLAAQAIGLAESAGDLSGLAEAFHQRGQLDQRAARYEAGLDALHRALDLYGVIGNAPGRARALRTIGFVHDDLGDYGRALEHHMQALAIDEATGDDVSRAATLRTIGIVYSKWSDPRQGLDFYQQSLALSRALGDIDSSARTLNNIGINRKNLGDLEGSRAALDEALALFRGIGSRHGEAGVLTNLGLTLEKLGRLDEAEQHQRDAARIAGESDYAMGEVKALSGLGELLVERNRHDEALEELTRALALADRMAALPERAKCHRALAELHKRAGRAEAALAHFETYHRLDRDVFNEASDRKLRALQVGYQLEQSRKEAEILRLRQVELASANAELQSLNASLVQADTTKTRLLAQLERLSQEDALTGVANRRRLDAALAEAFERARRDGRALAVALADIDFFKQINDRCSHAIGDEVLRRVARLLQAHCRAADLVARYGGEEFAVVLPATDAHGAAVVCEKMRAAIESADWSALHPGLAVTISIGIADDLALPGHEKLLAAADARLYQAKRAGKNQVRWT